MSFLMEALPVTGRATGRSDMWGNWRGRDMELRTGMLGIRAVTTAAVVCLTAGVAFGARLTDWTTVASEEFGFMIAYPANVFTPDDARSRDGGHVLVSRDGRARLLVATFENDGNASLDDYRRQLLDENYPDADLDFTPVSRKWFILSGTQGETHFYYRVNFTCGGRLINSWALIYPVSERRFYDRVVEAVARTYTPGAGRTGHCE
ncbi:MAG: hypothetical protein ACT4N2_11585 [Hyphomicrobium sp.]